VTARARGVADDTTISEQLGDPRITAIGLLFEAVGGLDAKLTSQLAEHGLAAAEFEVLIRIARTPGQELRMTDLAAQTLLTTSGITRVVDRLERDGLVERRACPTDRRGAFAGITPAGFTRLGEVLPRHLELIEHWFTGRLDSTALDAMLANLRTIRDGVRPNATAGA
jgi:DNA-binding MarR family transcriptional regulator